MTRFLYAKTGGDCALGTCPWGINRARFEGILWDLRTGRRGGFYPNEYPIARGVLATAETAGRRGRMAQRLANVVGALDAEGLLKWDEAFLDGSFAPAKNGARQSVKPSAARE